MQKVMEAFEKFRPAVCWADRLNGLTPQHNAVFLIVFGSTSIHRQPILLILDIAPEQIV